MFKLLLGVFLPFLGTSIGAFLVFFLKDKISWKINKIMLGFAAGVMIASSVWSLIIPSISYSENMGYFSFFPAFCGICLGVIFMVLLGNFCLKITSKTKENGDSLSVKTKLLFLAVTIHNIPEGMAVGVALAGIFWGYVDIALASALVFSFGIAVQNIPEGAIVSLPFKIENFSKKKAFCFGVLSGLVEPMFALMAIFLVKFIAPILPYLLSFAAGSMIYVSVHELIPESHEGEHSKISTIFFVIGFLIMMILDVSLG